MMLRSLGLATLALVLALPAAAQQKDTAAQQDIRKQIEAVTTKWLEAYNQGDAKAAATLVTPDAIAISSGAGMITGTQKYEERIQNEAKMGGKMTLSVEQVRTLGNDAAVAAGPFTVTYAANAPNPQVQGNWLRVFDRQGGDWKVVASTFSRLITPTASTATTGTTSTQPTTGTSTPPATGPTTK